MPDLWAYCEPCARWFYCSRAERACPSECPACGVRARMTREGRPTAPTAMVDELATAPGEPHQDA